MFCKQEFFYKMIPVQPKHLPLTILATMILGLCSCEGLQLTPLFKQVVKRVNESFIIQCYGQSAKDYTWIRPDGSPLPRDTSARIRVEEGRDIAGTMKGPHLIFERISKSDMGEYKCTAKVEGQMETTSFRLNVIKPISFAGSPSSVEGTPGKNILLPCKVDGEPDLTIHWQFEGKELKASNFNQTDKGLEIINPTLKNVGDYQCRALQMQTGDFNFHTVSLRLKHKPTWVTNNTVVYGYIGGTASLNCMVSAEPAPTFLWQRNSHDINQGSPNSHHVIENSSIKDQHNSSLKIHIKDSSAFGEYKCKVSNPLGTLSRIYELKEGIKPTKPNSVQLVQLSSSSATISIAEAPKGDNITGYRVEYISGETNSSNKWQTHKFIEFLKKATGGPNHYVITNLTESTLYQVRVASRNDAGLSEYAELETSFKTTQSATSSVSTLVFNVLTLLPAVFISLSSRS